MTEDQIAGAVARASFRAWLENSVKRGLRANIANAKFENLSDEELDFAQAHARAVIAAHKAALAESGLVIVPKEPTKPMLDAYMGALDQPLPDGDKRYPFYRSKAIKRYAAMVAAVEQAHG